MKVSRSLILLHLTCGVALGAPPVPVTVHADRVVGEIRPIWNYFGYDEAGTTLTREGRDLLGKLNALSDEPIRVRVHHLLTSGDGTLALKWSSTNVYTEDAAGNPRYDWTRLDAIMDELTKPGIEPFVQASFMPQALSSQPEPYTPTLVKSGLPRDMVSGGAFYPPKDYRKWEALIEAWARHSGERYGIERASSWLWELWNEPESPYWRGTKAEYFKLYDHFAAAVKRALPKARVGGPHVTDPAWKNGDVFMREFLEHCRSGKNAATGGVGAPLDFVAFHAKGTTRLDEKGRVEMNLRNHLKTIDTYGRIIASFPEFARLPIYIGESDPEGCAGCPATLDPGRDYRRTSQFASYTAASFMRKQDLLARTGGDLQGAVSWAFTFAEQPWFNGLRALTTNEVALPVLNTFELFAKLGPRRVAVDAPSMIPVDTIIADSVRGEPDLGAIASIDEARSRLTILLWNYHDVAGGYEDRREVHLTLTGLADTARRARAVEYSIDETSGNSYTAWLAMGSPQSPTADQIATLHAAAKLRAVPRDITRASTGKAQLRLVLPRHSVKLIEIDLASGRALNPPIGMAAPADSAIPMLGVVNAPSKCQAMKGRQIGAASILNAELATSPGTEAQYCKVSALIGKALNFEVQMPKEWNRRLLYLGGGGWAGSIVMISRTPTAELAGYVRVASDGGHQGSLIDASWAINNPKAQGDFAYLSVHTVLQATNPIVHAYYGEAPRFRYFEGCSNGGREALISASRFPEDFDGIIAGAPAHNWTALVQAFGRNAQHQAGTPLNPEHSRAIDQAVMSQCDKQDGVVDGILSNSAACKFDPGTLQCGKSAAPDKCLTEPQVATARTFYSEVRSRSGARVYPAFWPGGESHGWPAWITGGLSAKPGAPVIPIGAQQVFYEGMVKYWLMADPSYDVGKFDFDEHAPAVRQSGLMLNAGPDLTAFFALGHKLILWHGASDWAISAQASVDYFDAVAQSVGGASKRNESMEFYLAPSVQHCVGGSGADTFSFTEPLTAWVERGTRPGATRQTARKLDSEGKTLFTRPLCAHPAILKYKGKGNVADAISFECAQP